MRSRRSWPRPRGGRCVRRNSCRSSRRNSPTSTTTVPDSIFDRSRMSLMSISRSLPDEWIVLANSVCLGVRLPSGFLRQLVGEDQQAVERRAQLVRHVGQELGLVLGGQGQLLGLFFQRLAGLFDFLVLAFDFLVLVGQQAGLFLQFLVGLLQLFLPALQLLGQRLRLLEQVLRAHVGFDRVEHDADGSVSWSRNAWCVGLKRSNDASSSTPLTWPSKTTGSTRMFCGGGFAQAGGDADVIRRHVGRAGSSASPARTGRPALRPGRSCLPTASCPCEA